MRRRIQPPPVTPLFEHVLVGLLIGCAVLVWFLVFVRGNLW